MSDSSRSSGSSTSPSASRQNLTLNSFETLFQELMNKFKSIFNETKTSPFLKDRNDENLEINDEDDEDNEEYFEINIGNEFAEQLEEKFSDLSLPLVKECRPTVIELPVSLGRQLFLAYVESIYRQQDAENQIFADIIKEDEEFERQLEVELLKQEQNDFAFDGISSRNFIKQACNDDEIDATYLYDVIWADKKRPFECSSEIYRSLAKDHMQKRDKFKALANKELTRNPKMAQKYFAKSKNAFNSYLEANDLAAAAALVENYRKNPKSNTIDLHHLFVKEALAALDIFLDKEIETLQGSINKSRTLLIITGRGKHSVNGIAKIKPEVLKHLKERGLRAFNINSGSLQTKVDRNSMYAENVQY